MAENENDNGDRTEEATPERREEFRDRGQVAFSRELSSVISLGCLVYVIYYWWKYAPKVIMEFTKKYWSAGNNIRPSLENIGGLLSEAALIFLKITVPLFLVVGFTYGLAVFVQTKFNFTWEKISFDISKLEPFSGFKKIISTQSLVELLKSIGKLLVVGFVAYLVLVSEWVRLPLLMHLPFGASWQYWGMITKNLFLAVIGLLLTISLLDYFYQYMTIEKQLKMTKEEVKQEYKQREVDPHVRNKMRRMQRDNVARNKIARTRKATVIVTNPTHFSIALKYELGQNAPILLAKGEDDLALRMRLVAKEENIPIVENKKLARALYAQVEEGEEIPSKFYAAVAEVIRYVYRLTGKKVPQKKKLDSDIKVM